MAAVCAGALALGVDLERHTTKKRKADVALKSIEDQAVFRPGRGYMSGGVYEN